MSDSAGAGGCEQSARAALQNHCFKVTLIVVKFHSGGHLSPEVLRIVEQRQSLFAA